MADGLADLHPGDFGAAFDDFYRTEWPGALRLATLLMQDASASEDAAQEAFSRVLARWNSIESPGAYLHNTLVNVCRRWQRRRSGEHQRLPMLLPPTASEPVCDEMADALAALSYRQRAVIILRFYADLSEAEIAAALDCKPGTVKSLASRALDELRKVIER
jgi:RNA polymerase sigma-70 factor (sigma-E family)